MEKIGTRLTQLRKAKGMSMQQVADYLDIPRTTYRGWEYGSDIGGEPYLRLCEIFEVDLYELITGRSQVLVQAQNMFGDTVLTNDQQ